MWDKLKKEYKFYTNQYTFLSFTQFFAWEFFWIMIGIAILVKGDSKFIEELLGLKDREDIVFAWVVSFTSAARIMNQRQSFLVQVGAPGLDVPRYDAAAASSVFKKWGNLVLCRSSITMEVGPDATIDVTDEAINQRMRLYYEESARLCRSLGKFAVNDTLAEFLMVERPLEQPRWQGIINAQSLEVGRLSTEIEKGFPVFTGLMVCSEIGRFWKRNFGQGIAFGVSVLAIVRWMEPTLNHLFYGTGFGK